MRQYETVIGLEVHIELATKTKIFCGCSTELAESQYPYLSGMCRDARFSSGSERQVVEFALKAGIAANCQINQLCKFDRKIIFILTIRRIIRYHSSICLCVMMDG
mgnify:CR=1 FL=1